MKISFGSKESVKIVNMQKVQTQLSNCNRCESIKSNAQELAKTLDISFPNIKTAENYKMHLQDCINYPTQGRLAGHAFIEYATRRYSRAHVEYNAWLIKTADNEVRDLLKKFKAVRQELYPKTQKAREYIIKDGRLNYERVTKSKGYGLIDRLGILLTRIK